MANKEKVPIKIHPRAFSAFGEDLVTSDFIALTELVKNSYDAFAYNVKIEFGENERGPYIQIEDDGIGMTEEVIRESWATMATPNKLDNPIIERNGVERKVSGNKGLGRFSAARLGQVMYICTKNEADVYLKISIIWRDIVDAENMEDCTITIESIEDPSPFASTGTIIRIEELKSTWSEKRIDELRDILSRLIKPFETQDKFSITLQTQYSSTPLKIEPSIYIENPTYKISGNVDKTGNIFWNYIYVPLNPSKDGRILEDNIMWEETKKISKSLQKQLSLEVFSDDEYSAGPFSFEIRAWDLDKDSVIEASELFNINRVVIRSAISQYNGISVYRDGILVIPKSKDSKDWLGVDLRRISRVGKRISTSQIVGIVNITSSDNPEIRDATNREKLVKTSEYDQFIRILLNLIGKLEDLRDHDRQTNIDPGKPTLKDVFADISAEDLVKRVENAVAQGESSKLILKYVQDFGSQNKKGLDDLQERLIYYGQTASLGSVSVVILHEILNGMNAITRFLRRIEMMSSSFDGRTMEYYNDACNDSGRILEVAQCFSPLASRNLYREKVSCDLLEIVNSSLQLAQAQNPKYHKINVINEIPDKYEAMVHSSVLSTILLNLLGNACYWVEKHGGEQILKISSSLDLEDADHQRLKIRISDTGVGIPDSDVLNIFKPGYTTKTNGIGMGLVIVTELLSHYDGKVGVVLPSELGGATIEFDIPIKIKGEYS